MLSADKARLYMEPENFKKNSVYKHVNIFNISKINILIYILKYTHLHPHLIIKGFLIEI